MKKQHWSRLLLWSHVVSGIGFYILLWFRTRPDDQNKSEQREGKLAVAKTGRAVSIIVPARNEERNIRRCVTSLLEQDYDNYEVIVVDDGSTDGTAGILDDITHRHPRGDRLWVLRLRELPEGGLVSHTRSMLECRRLMETGCYLPMPIPGMLLEH